jgi:serine/threonine-protein kinase
VSVAVTRAGRTEVEDGPRPGRRRRDVVEVVEPSPPGWRLPAALAVVVLALALAVWTWSDDVFARHAVDDLPRVELPSVAELGVDAAEHQLEALGFVVAIVPRPNETVPKGTAFGQEPVAGRKLELGELVSILVSDGPAGVVVPKVAGQQVADVSALLASDGLGTTFDGTYDELLPVGQVIASEPAAGERVPLNGSVKLTVSFGPAPRTVPALVGTDLNSSLVAIGRAGLAVGTITRVHVKDQFPGVVLETTPPGGAKAPRDMPIKLRVTGPPPTVAVRSFTGLLQSSAETVAKATGVSLEVVTTPVAAGDPRIGRVVAQGVPPYAEVTSGSRVQVTVAVAS